MRCLRNYFAILFREQTHLLCGPKGIERGTITLGSYIQKFNPWAYRDYPAFSCRCPNERSAQRTLAVRVSHFLFIFSMQQRFRSEIAFIRFYDDSVGHSIKVVALKTNFCVITLQKSEDIKLGLFSASDVPK